MLTLTAVTYILILNSNPISNTYELITRYENLIGILNCQMCVLNTNVMFQNTHLTIQNPHYILALVMLFVT